MAFIDLLTDVDKRSDDIDTSLDSLAGDSHVMRSLMGGSNNAPSESTSAASMVDRLAKGSRMMFGAGIKGTPKLPPQQQMLQVMKEREKQYRADFDRGETGPVGQQNAEGPLTSDMPGAQTISDLMMSPAVSTATNIGLRAADPFTGGLMSTLFPETMSKAREETSTGSEFADTMLGVAEGLLPYVNPLAPVTAPIAIAGSVASTATKVGRGEESVLAGAADVATLPLMIRGFSAAQAIESPLLRLAGLAGVGAGTTVAQSAIHGKLPSVAEALGGALGGAVGGIGHRLPGVKGESPTQQSFVEHVTPYAERASQETGIPTEVIVGQWAHESDFGQSHVAKTTGNLAGIKTADAAASGAETYQPFGDMDAFTDKYINTIKHSRYDNVREVAKNGGGAKEIGDALHQAGYAEDPHYGDKLAARTSQVAGDVPAVQATEQITQQEPTQAPAQAATETPEQQVAGAELDKQIAAIEQPVEQPAQTELDLGDHAAYQPGQYITDAPIVEHEIQNGPNAGNTRRGVVATDLSYEQARAIDPYAHAKDDGFFIGERHVSRPEGYEEPVVPEATERAPEAKTIHDVAKSLYSDVKYTGNDLANALESAGLPHDRADVNRLFNVMEDMVEDDGWENPQPKEGAPPSESSEIRNEAGRTDSEETRGDIEAVTPKEEAQIAGSEVKEDLTDEAAGHTPEDIQRARQFGELHSEIIPGAAALIEQDILPRIKKFGEGAQDVFERTQGNLAPATTSEAAELTRQSLLEPLGHERHRLTQVVTQTVKERAAFNKQKAAENVRFQLAMEEGKAMKQQWQSDAANKLRSLYNESAELTRTAGDRTGHNLLPNLKENYNYGSFKYDPKLAEQVLGEKPTGKQTMATLRGKGSRLLRGQAGFLKEKTMTLRDHLERGEVPMHDNPFEQYFEYEKQAARLRTAHHAIGNIVDRGVGQIVNPVDEPAARQAVRDGLMHPQDPSFSVRQATEEGTLKGHDIYIPPESWQLIKNHLSSGPQNALAKLVMPFNMLHNMTTLFGVAHATITAENWVGTRGANTLTRLAKGEILDAGKTLGDNFYGRKIRNEYLKPGSIDDPSVKEDVEWIKKIGGGIERNPVNYKEFTRSFTRAMVNNNYLGALPRGAGAAIENMTGWLMHDLVPMAKLDAFRTEYRTALKNLPEGASEIERTEAVANAWSSIDDRMGEVFRDRNFMNKNVMFWADLVFPRANWTFGTYKALGKGVADTYRAGRNIVTGKRPQLTSNMAFFPAYAMMAVMPVNTALQKLMTGKWPWETDTPLKDMLLGARDGGMLKDGSASRISMVNYIRDIASMVKDPSGTLAAKMSPIFSVFKYWQNNSDYRHDQVYDPSADYATQAMQVGKMMASEMFQPFIVSNVKRLASEGASAYATVGSMLGMSPVSVGASQSELGQVLGEYYKRKNALKAGLSPELRKQADNEREVLAAYRTSPTAGDTLAGKLGVDWEKAKHLAKVSSSSPLQSQMYGTDLETATKAFRVATPLQRTEIEEIVKEKAIKEKDHAIGDAVLHEFGWQRPPLTAQEARAAQTKEAVHSSFTPSQAAAQEAQAQIAKKLGVHIPTPAQQVSQSRKGTKGLHFSSPSIRLPGIR